LIIQELIKKLNDNPINKNYRCWI